MSRNWRTGGVANVNQNFVRLTPDRQSKKGAIWSRKSIGVESFSSILKFRISGQGKSFFGDGIGLWMTQQGYYIEGDVHGSVEKFTGVGIIFDTFKNTENIAVHRDVTILVNDGSKMIEEMFEGSVKGCDNNCRYHAERADFSVTDASRVKVIVEGNHLALMMDAKNSGIWSDCVSMDLPLSFDWAKRAHIGLTASTGQLADNHDVLSLITYSDLNRMEEDELAAATEKNFDFGEGLGQKDRFQRIEEAMDKLMGDVDVLNHHIEHEFASVKDHISSMLGKLESREGATESRVDGIEEIIEQTVSGSIEDRLISLETQMKGQMNRKIKKLESSFENQISTTIQGSLDGVAGGWKLPFLLVVLIVIGGVIGLYFYYLKLKKMHIL